MKVKWGGDAAHGKTSRTVVPLRKNTMEKILLAMDGYKQNTYAIDFACYLAKLTHSRLTGVFLEGAPEGMEEITNGALAADPVLPHVRRFREACLCREVPVRVHRDRGVPIADILLESRFSDLIVVDPETSFHNADKSFPDRFIRDVLLAAECPVVVSPYQFEALNEVIFAYNGTSSSVFAIKQFTYLFPEFKNKKVVVV